MRWIAIKRRLPELITLPVFSAFMCSGWSVFLDIDFIKLPLAILGGLVGMMIAIKDLSKPKQVNFTKTTVIWVLLVLVICLILGYQSLNGMLDIEIKKILLGGLILILGSHFTLKESD